MTMHETRAGLLETEVKNPVILAQQLREGADPNGRIRNAFVLPLDVAVVHGRVESCQMLLDAGADPNGADGQGATALCSIAASVANGWSTPEQARQIVDLLLQAGANPTGEKTAKLAAVPIYHAGIYGNGWLMRRLVEAGAELDLITEFADPALQAKTVVEAIFETGNDVGVLCALQLGVDDSGFAKNGRSFYEFSRY